MIFILSSDLNRATLEDGDSCLRTGWAIPRYQSPRGAVHTADGIATGRGISCAPCTEQKA